MTRVLLLAALALVVAAPAGAFEYADCNGLPCQWDTYPISFSIRDPLGVDLPEQATLKVLEDAVMRWNAGRQTFCAPLEFSYQGRITVGDPDARDSRNIVFFESDDWPHPKEALAVTTLWFDGGGKLREADIGFNAVDWTWSLDEANPPEGLYSVKPTLTHEAGHFWGVGHSDLRDATMYAYYKPATNAEDLDEDDIQAAALRFCGEAVPSDDGFEQNDSYFHALPLEDRTELADLRLYDDDWFRLTLAEGRRLKVTVVDEEPGRYKSLELYGADGAPLDRQPCDGDCAQALGEAGAERIVNLRIHGDFDNHAIDTAQYGFALDQVVPGEEGELTDDDEPASGDDDDDDSGGRCAGCGVSEPGAGGASTGALLLGGLAALIWLRRRG
jgi:Matrixin